MLDTITVGQSITAIMAVGGVLVLLWKPIKSLTDLVNQFRILTEEVKEIRKDYGTLEKRVDELDEEMGKVSSIEKSIDSLLAMQKILIRGQLSTIPDENATPEQKQLKIDIENFLINR